MTPRRNLAHRRAARRAEGVKTRVVHGAEAGRSGPITTPIVHSATFGFPSLDAMNEQQSKGPAGAFYQRHGHPTLRAIEERLAHLEGAETALLFSSGIAGVAAILLSQLTAGDHVVALHQCYGGTHDLLKWGAERFGWSCELVDARTPEDWDQSFRQRTRLLHVESPTNPTLCVVDLRRAAELAHRHGARLSVDNTFASPLGQHPLALGADLVAYSATKSIGGHSDLLAGVVMGPQSLMEPVWKTRKIFGAVPDPGIAWQIERSLKTLALRVQAANANALELARRLSAHASVRQVFYPGLPGHPGHDIAKRQMEMGFGPVLGRELPADRPRGEPGKRGIARIVARPHVPHSIGTRRPGTRGDSGRTDPALHRNRRRRRSLERPGPRPPESSRPRPEPRSFVPRLNSRPHQNLSLFNSRQSPSLPSLQYESRISAPPAREPVAPPSTRSWISPVAEQEEPRSHTPLP
ncbi:MAG: aminotransferase class I/II-fold pyridoxal phosphate-dependent enzyme [Candidatus Eisenbacteria bacterium]|uniref:Aminotransferase class I/II-fold pyridoxal phosphate-dependent enzyme n=1 Tax=Eiseniibacteriota bacterium TaxID=2212470 RepID=A0A538U3E0_UNCEI|nr:MAG: aminotransferase class I/II-fold pyridoxal phosphate-dependent enzyme [Candidatus Eisenbacteria bacterium]